MQYTDYIKQLDLLFQGFQYAGEKLPIETVDKEILSVIYYTAWKAGLNSQECFIMVINYSKSKLIRDLRHPAIYRAVAAEIENLKNRD